MDAHQLFRLQNQYFNEDMGLAKKGPLGNGNLGSTRANSQQLGRNMILEGRPVMLGQAAGHPRPHNEMYNRKFHEKVRDRLKNVVETMKNRGRRKKQLDVL